LTITFNEGNAGILAEAIAEAMRKMGKNPVEVRNLTGTPGGAPPPPPKTPSVNPFAPTTPANPGPPAPGGGTPPAPAPHTGDRTPPPGLPPLMPPIPPGGISKVLMPGRDVKLVSYQIVDPNAKQQKPVIITVVGNRLTIESEDQTALQ